ncbi:WD40 repeat-containing protein [Crinalium epipsammum PCC 9333]|uniref:WD40 repeat-containing protein n=1 Tax=Crinalium epipsammum PCC 9333 TaxID=1173022 RepID=K9W2N1_9CYAN|nr:WD40 repeat domain-containing protein [Crinalium epipsammum]AFZ14017.1 WD40 repeat-containing protein [Crinalium epipsammum PCC 9333]
MGSIATKLASKSAEFKKMFLGQFPEQQLKAGKSEIYYQYLTDFDFIFLKIHSPKFGVEPLIRDYALIDDPEILDKLEEDETLKPEQVKTLKLIQRALQLAAHVVNQDQNQLVGQLWGRLQSFEQPEIQKMLADAAASESEISRLRPITASLTAPGGNLLRTLTGHNHSVRAVAITPDGKTAVSGSDDTTLKVWDLQTGTALSTLTGHNDSVIAVAITADGKTAVSGSHDNTLKVWDLKTGTALSTLTGHNDSVIAVAITADGKTAVSGSHDNTLKVWDLKTGTALSTLTAHSFWVQAVAITADGRTAVSGSDDNTLKVWDLKTGTALSTLTAHSFWVQAVAITADGKTAVSVSHDNTLKVWNLQTGTALSTLTGHNDSVIAVAITADGKTAVSGSHDNTLKVWDLQTGTALSTFIGHNDFVRAVAITPDGKTAVSGSDDNTVKVWDLPGTARSTLPAWLTRIFKMLKPEFTGTALSTLTGHNASVIAVAITPDGKTAVSGSEDNTLKVWDLQIGTALSILPAWLTRIFKILTLKPELHTGTALSTLTGHNNSVQAVAITPNGKTAVSGSEDNTLKVWDLQTGTALSTFIGHNDSVIAVAITPDGKTAVSGSEDNTLKVWDLQTGTALSTFIGHSFWAITADGKTAVSGSSDDNTLKVWDLQTGTALSTFIGHNDFVRAVAITPDGKTAVSGSDDNTVKVWDLPGTARSTLPAWLTRIFKMLKPEFTGTALSTLTGHNASVIAVAITPDGKTAVSGSEDNTLKVWDLQIGTALSILPAWLTRIFKILTLKPELHTGTALSTLTGHNNSVQAVAITPNGKTAVSGSEDNTLKVWDLQTGTALSTFIGHNDSVIAVAITPDGKTAVSGSEDNTLKVWDLQTGTALSTFIGESPINCCAVSPDGLKIVAGDKSGRVHFLRWERG